MGSDAWQALTGHPARFLTSSRPWRSLGYLLSGVVVASLWLSAVMLLVVVPAAGLLVLLAGVPLGAVERRRLRMVDRTPALSTHARPDARGAWAWAGTRFRETGTWRELGYALLFSLGLAWLDFAVAALVLCAAYLVLVPLLLVLRVVGDGAALLAAVADEVPDVVVTDVRMPPGFRDEGLRAALDLRRTHPGLPVLVLSQYVEPTYAAELVDSGAGVGYLLKNRVGEVAEFVDALTRVAAGGTVIDADVIRHLLGRHTARSRLDGLTAREREVLALMAEGRSNAAVARRLHVSAAAVAKHVNGIFTKLSLPPAPDDHRRVLAVLAHLRG